MATDLNVGDSEVPWLDVTPADATTAATLTVTDPAGTDTAKTVSGGSYATGTQRWTANTPVVYDTAGRWVLTWTVTGVGEGVETREVIVNPLPEAGGWPTWAPALSDVAAHIPYLTVDTTTTSAVFHGTFTDNTSPTATEALRHLDQALASVTAALGTVNTAVYPLAKVVAALRAAASIQRAYPRSPDDLANAAALDARADAELVRLVSANTSAGESPVPSALLPVYSFSDPVPWGDSYL